MSRISHSVVDGQRSWSNVDRGVSQDPEPRLTRDQIRAAMLRGLNRDEQLLLILWYAERMTPAEIAEVLDSTEEHVQIVHDHAIAQLRRSAAA